MDGYSTEVGVGYGWIPHSSEMDGYHQTIVQHSILKHANRTKSKVLVVLCVVDDRTPQTLSAAVLCIAVNVPTLLLSSALYVRLSLTADSRL